MATRGTKVETPNNIDVIVDEEAEIPDLPTKFPAAGPDALLKWSATRGKKGDRQLVGFDPDDRVRLVNLSFAQVSLQVPDHRRKIMVEGKPFFHMKREVIMPLGHILVPLSIAEGYFSRVEDKKNAIKLFVAPDWINTPVYTGEGDCRGELTMDLLGRTWTPCPYGKCGTHGELPSGVWWSSWQAMHFIRRLRHPSAMTRFVEDSGETRQDVLLFGMAMVQERHRTRAARMGVTVSTRR